MHSQDHLSPTLSSVLIIYVMSGSSDCSLAARLNRYLMLIMNERHTQTHSHRNEAHTPERRNKARQVGFKHAGLESLSEMPAGLSTAAFPPPAAFIQIILTALSSVSALTSLNLLLFLAVPCMYLRCTVQH